MAIGAYFRPASMNAEIYNEALRRLQAAGAGSPNGRLYHVCFGSGDHLAVFDIWDSQENFDRFGKTLMPILAEIGLDAGQPMIEPIENIIAGQLAGVSGR